MRHAWGAAVAGVPLEVYARTHPSWLDGWPSSPGGRVPEHGPAWPDLVLTCYRDDPTGSTDVMEAMALCGVAMVLFRRPPSDLERSRFARCRAIGLAGVSRSETPRWMDEHLAPALRWLSAEGARFCHYQVCSTFDSGPRIGSIGRSSAAPRLDDQ